MPPPRRSRIRLDEIVIFALVTIGAVVIAAKEGHQALTPPLVPYGAFDTVHPRQPAEGPCRGVADSASCP